MIQVGSYVQFKLGFGPWDPFHYGVIYKITEVTPEQFNFIVVEDEELKRLRTNGNPHNIPPRGFSISNIYDWIEEITEAEYNTHLLLES